MIGKENEQDRRWNKNKKEERRKKKELTIHRIRDASFAERRRGRRRQFRNIHKQRTIRFPLFLSFRFRHHRTELPPGPSVGGPSFCLHLLHLFHGPFFPGSEKNARASSSLHLLCTKFCGYIWARAVVWIREECCEGQAVNVGPCHPAYCYYYGYACCFFFSFSIVNLFYPLFILFRKPFTCYFIFVFLSLNKYHMIFS